MGHSRGYTFRTRPTTFGSVLVGVKIPKIAQVFVFLFFNCGISEATALRLTKLTCEYLREPLGIDNCSPRLSWSLQADSDHNRNREQKAYEIQAATSLTLLEGGAPNLWASGRIESNTNQINYSGEPLRSHTDCFWRVRVWDENATLSEWSAIAHWSMGLLSDADKHANWIGAKHLKQQASDHLQEATWIWYPEGKADVAAPTGKRYFRRIVDLPTDEIKQAKLLFTADDAVDFYVNGEKVGRSENWRLAAEVNVAKFLKPGRNILSASAQNSPPHRNPAPAPEPDSNLGLPLPGQ